MKFEKKKLLTTVSAVALVLAVGACSSGNDDGISAERDTALSDLKAANAKVTSLTGELADANAEVMRLEDLIGDETDPADDSVRGMLAIAKAEVMRLDGLIGDETDPAAESLRGQLAAAKARIGSADDPDSLEGQLAAAEALIDNNDPDNLGLMQQLAAAKMELKDLEDAAAIDLANMNAAEANARAKALRAGIENDGSGAPRMFTVTHTAADGVKALLDPVDGDSDYKPTDAVAADVGEGWNGMVLAKEAGTDSTESVTIYTGIDLPGPKSLIVDEGGTATATSFPVTDEADFVKNAAAMGAPTAPEVGATTVLLGVEQMPAVGAARLEFSGNWRGIAGTFICTATNCDDEGKLELTASTNADGEQVLTANLKGQTWVFAPTDPRATVMVQDEDYLRFGWWQDRPTKAGTDGAFAQYGFQAFASGSQAFSDSDLQAVGGKATYKGPAAGSYVRQVDAFEGTFKSGTFTAKTTLQADFQDDQGMGTISGKVTDFMEGASALTGWEVTLKFTGADTVDIPSDGEIAGEAAAEIQNAVGTGTWAAEFFGTRRNDGMPGSIAGTFNADFGPEMARTANIEGAFGASNTKADSK